VLVRRAELLSLEDQLLLVKFLSFGPEQCLGAIEFDLFFPEPGCLHLERLFACGKLFGLSLKLLLSVRRLLFRFDCHLAADTLLFMQCSQLHVELLFPPVELSQLRPEMRDVTGRFDDSRGIIPGTGRRRRDWRGHGDSLPLSLENANCHKTGRNMPVVQFV
jgi:hypothetical protein